MLTSDKDSKMNSFASHRVELIYRVVIYKGKEKENKEKESMNKHMHT